MAKKKKFNIESAHYSCHKCSNSGELQNPSKREIIPDACPRCGDASQIEWVYTLSCKKCKKSAEYVSKHGLNSDKKLECKHCGQSFSKSASREYSEATITAIIIAVLLRIFVIEAFKIPSKSMVPTLMVGDHIFVNKFIYGIRLPFTKYWLTHFKEPQRGDVMVFIYPRDDVKQKSFLYIFSGLVGEGNVNKLEHALGLDVPDFIKRVVGLPGDRIRFSGDDVFINGEKLVSAPIEVVGNNPENKRQMLIKSPSEIPDSARFKTIPYAPEWQDFTYYLERLGDKTHLKQEAGRQMSEGEEIVVPEGHLFVMGDNRDQSSDSREWGFVPRENLVGKAMFIWLSLDHDLGGLRWDRFGNWIR